MKQSGDTRMKINLNFRLLYQSVVLSTFAAGLVFGGFYLIHLLLSLVFSSFVVFLSLFVVAVGVGVFLTYDTTLFQWDNHPRIAVKGFRRFDGRDY